MSNELGGEKARRRLLVVVAFSSAAGLVALDRAGWLDRQPGFIAEAAIYLAIAAVLASVPVVRDDILALPRFHRLFLLVLTGFVVFAQFVGGGGDVFPGARWAMFSDEVRAVETTVVIATMSDQSEILIRPDQLFGALRNGRDGSLLDRTAREGELEAVVAALTERYTKLRPDADILAIRVVDVSIPDSGSLQGHIVRTTRAEIEP